MREERIEPKWSWDAINAVLCFGGGILAGLLGSLLTSGTWIWGPDLHPWVRRIGTGLLILTIPLLILAGHCLDRMENRGKREAERCSSTGKVSRCIPQILTVGVIVLGLLVYAATSQNLYANPINRVAEQDKITALETSNRPTRLSGRKPEGGESKSTNTSDRERQLLERLDSLERRLAHLESRLEVKDATIITSASVQPALPSDPIAVFTGSTSQQIEATDPGEG